MGIAILTPLTFWLEPEQGMAVLLGIYNSAIWAGRHLRHPDQHPRHPCFYCPDL